MSIVYNKNISFCVLLFLSFLSENCSHPQECLQIYVDQHCECRNEVCVLLLERSCPNDTFPFPLLPIVYGHVRLVYSLSIRQNLKECTSVACRRRLKTPDYICYRLDLCPLLTDSLLVLGKDLLNDSTLQCYRTDDIFDIFIMHNMNTWRALVRLTTELIATCSIHVNKNASKDDTFSLANNSSHSTLYRCIGMNKYISKYRLLDGTYDCFLRDDEDKNNHKEICSYKYRYKCAGMNDICISSINILDGKADCPLNDDEKQIRPIYFTLLCDGYVSREAAPDDPEKETDETNCEEWSCNNKYTRCDGQWHCDNGEDEVNCPDSPCSPNHHLCISINTSELICLPLALANNGIIDCFGASDERSFCREEYNLLMAQHRYRCNDNKTTKCIRVSAICNEERDCPLSSKDDENPKICGSATHNKSNESVFNPYLCPMAFKKTNISINKYQFLCDLQDIALYIANDMPEYRPYFSLRSQQLLPFYVQSRTVIPESQLARTATTDYKVDLRRAHICNRGILIYEHNEERCLCPPAYYGLRCEFQNQRVSITFQIRTALRHTHFQFVIMLIDDDEHEIESYEQISYLGIRDCNFKYNLNLLYISRPKNINKSYSVRIDAFDALSTSVVYHGSWLFPITHSFLPVYRLALQLSLRTVHPHPLKIEHTNCSCGSHGQCFAYMNTGEFFCRCIHHGWRGKSCQIPTEITRYYCSSDSISIGSSICVCPLGKFGSRCLIGFASICGSSNPCAHGGTCIPVNPRMTLAYSSLFTCACNEGFSGKTCEQIDTQLDIHFPDDMTDIPSSVLIHFITVRDDNDPERTTTVKRIPFGQNSIRVYRSFPFHLVFVEIMDINHQQKSFYLVFEQQIYIPAVNISTSEFHRCSPLNELFNSMILSYSPLRRVKYYHKACQKRFDLTCFYDDEQFMCLCTDDHNANCSPFDFNMSYTCQGYDYCENHGECFQNHPTCPTSAVCLCPECYYGSRCQFYTYGFGISLDTILGYHIWPQVTLTEQPAAFKLSIVITVFICALGLINGALTGTTFYSETSDDNGCRLYLFTGAINSLFITFLFALKFIFLVITQLNTLTSYTVLTIQCLSIDFLVKILLAANDWFASCVATERVFTIIYGIQFNSIKSKQIAKYMIFSIYLFTCTSYLHESIYRSLVDDVGDQRTWCVVRYPQPAIQYFASLVNIFHLIVPFSINILSAIFIILCITRIRFHVKKQKTGRRQLLYQQVIKYKHLFISSILLVTLKLPGLLISVLSGCMKSQSRNIPWLFLSGYFMSFVPSLLTFITFVIPSVTYMSSFRKGLQKVRRTML